MLKLQGRDIYLAALEREDCRKLWSDFEYDFDCPAEAFNIGASIEKADAWFDEIQKLQFNTHVRLGVFLNNGTVIGDVALQDIDRANRGCTIGMGFAKLEHRGRGYGRQAVGLMLSYGFGFLGLERVAADTLDINMKARRSLAACGFTLEGRARRAVYLNGQYHDRLYYAILKEEYFSKSSSGGNRHEL